MCFGGGGQQQPTMQVYYTPYPTASQVYGERYAQQPGGYGYPGPQTNPDAGAAGILTRPSTGANLTSGGGGGISTIGSEAHMSNIPGASQLLGQYGFSNTSPMHGWF